jgi:hypothetical protein
MARDVDSEPALPYDPSKSILVRGPLKEDWLNEQLARKNKVFAKFTVVVEGDQPLREAVQGTVARAGLDVLRVD